MNSNVQAAGVSPVGKPSPLNVGKLIDQYIALRDRKREIESAHKATLVPFNKAMGEIEAKMLAHMQKSEVNSVNADAGTAYQTTKPSATIRDGAAFRQWVVETGAYQIVDWRANANAVAEFIAASEGSVPPGVNYSTRTSVNFRRPNEKE